MLLPKRKNKKTREDGQNGSGMKKNLNEFQKRNLIPVEENIFQGKRYIDPATKKEMVYLNISEKGDIIRHVLGLIGRSDKNSEHYGDYVVYVDGDGDIPYNYVIDVIKSLLKDLNCEGICLTCRKGELNMGDTRDAIERFELYLIERIYQISLPDGQCGLWGLDREVLENIDKLTAIGFEIEMDILLMTLVLDKIPYFVPITLSNVPSFFNLQEHKAKLKFLIRKLKLSKELLLPYYDNFTLEYPDYKLPDVYLDLLGTVTGYPLERRVSKCMEEGDCRRCDLKNFN